MQETGLMCKKEEQLSPKRKIIELLRDNDAGMTIATLSKLANVSRHTASIVLAELRGARLVDVRDVGAAKLHFWRGVSK